MEARELNINDIRIGSLVKHWNEVFIVEEITECLNYDSEVDHFVRLRPLVHKDNRLIPLMYFSSLVKVSADKIIYGKFEIISR